VSAGAVTFSAGGFERPIHKESDFMKRAIHVGADDGGGPADRRGGRVGQVIVATATLGGGEETPTVLLSGGAGTAEVAIDTARKSLPSHSGSSISRRRPRPATST
jgi:hypothetical protein